MVGDSEGEHIASYVASYPIFYLKEGWAEHDPKEWWLAFVTASRELMKTSDTTPPSL